MLIWELEKIKTLDQFDQVKIDESEASHMRLGVLNLDSVRLVSQEEKVREEYEEWMNAGTKAEKLAESWDVIQAMLGFILKFGSHAQVAVSNKQHIHKLEVRDRNGGFKINGYLVLNYEEAEGA